MLRCEKEAFSICTHHADRTFLFQCKQNSDARIELALSFAIDEILLFPLLSCSIAPAIIPCDCLKLNGGKRAHGHGGEVLPKIGGFESASVTC
jgi:hypothetical protein